MRTQNPDHFDHEDHRERLERAAELMESLGKHDLAGACRRARALHVNLIGRVSHARYAIRRLKRVGDSVWEVRHLLESYVAQPEAPWLEPTPVLFPLEETDHE